VTRRNILDRLRVTATAAPERPALVFPVGRGSGAATRFETWTYQHVDRVSDAYARGFRSVGITKGTRAVVMLKPGPDLFAVVLALFKLGAVPVIVDPGMGPKRMLHCYETVGAEAFIGVPLAHLVRIARPRAFRSVKVLITVGGPRFWGGHSLRAIAEPSADPLPLTPVAEDDTQVINFTTGSTGPARGVEYTQAGVDAMVETLRSLYDAHDDVVSFITLPLFALLDMLLGSTTVLAPMNPTKPASIDAKRLVAVIARFRCTHMFGSPALLNRLGIDAEAAGLSMPSLRVVMSGGAPVMPRIIEQFRRVLAPEARVLATYGATEALPMASSESREFLGQPRAETAAGGGTFLGRPVDGLTFRIVPITDMPMPTAPEEAAVTPGAVGELAVRGGLVSPRYHADPANDALAKMKEGEHLWHRTGDLGRRDAAGRLWFAGRKSDRISTPTGTLFTAECEGIFNEHPDVGRSALVGVGPPGSARPVICIEPRTALDSASLARIEDQLRALAQAHARTREIDTFLFHPGFPVDLRHNAKIGRDLLAAWATRCLVPSLRTARRSLYIIPVAGWIYLLYGALFPFTHPVLHALWILDLVLSVGAHGAQLVTAIPRARRAGYPAWTAVFKTFLLGATWWKFLEARELRGRNPGGA